VFLPSPQPWGFIAELLGISSLVWAGVLFMWAAVPYRDNLSSRFMLVALLAFNTLYICALLDGRSAWIISISAALLGIVPLAIALACARTLNHPLRWSLVALYVCVSIYLSSVQHKVPNGPDLALNGLLCAVYLGCCIYFWYAYRRATAGAFITISGFFLWSLVFIAGPIHEAYFQTEHIESEVWNLPKYVVGIGMILLLLEEQIEYNKHLALHDVLTGLPNRRLFKDRLASAIERARRTGSRSALLVLDLNQFKNVNDTLGHHVGDLLLQRVASLFSARVRKSDTVARTGGDEFSVILEGPTSHAEAVHVGRSLQQLLVEPLSLNSRPVKIGVSFGVAIYPDDADEIEKLCIAADARMYEDKRRSAEVQVNGTETKPLGRGSQQRDD
jgi:diguanylate cyclase (GGDEF)-like protein